MALIVQKYGGTSVADPDRIRRVAARVARERRGGDSVVVVVSAMGDSTDDLLELAKQVTADARRRHPREFDMLLTAGERISMALLAMAIRDLGVEALSLTGSQAAIITDETHTGARIAEIRATRVREELANGCVVIVAGFQGVSRTREITTLGRGGSDTTAVALAAALGADRCDIFTDVDGVLTADPRRVPAARPVKEIDYNEMVELASAGAQVMHPRAVEIGAKFSVPIRVLSSFRPDDGTRGTLITRRRETMENLVVTGLASEEGYARLTLRGLPPTTETVGRVAAELGGAGISLDMLVLADRADGRRQIQLTVTEDVLHEALPICERIAAALDGEPVEVQRGLSRVALVGSGMQGLPGVYGRAFETLVRGGIEVHAVSTSAISITVLVDTANEERSLQLLHTAFDLDAETE
ncbi:MAG: aspartate kinase [Longimicrobiales bacterium]